MPAKLSYGACLLLVGSMMGSTEAQIDEGVYHLDFPRGRHDNRRYLASWVNCNNNALHIVDPPGQEGNHPIKWQVRKSGSGYSFESIDQRSMCPRRFISVPADCRHQFIDLWFRDDHHGQQTFNLTPAANGTYSMRIAGGRNCPRMLMSTAPRSNNPDLWFNDDNSGRQQVRFTKYDPAPVALPPVVQISSLGKTDGRVELTTDRNCGQQQAFLDKHEDLHREHGWKAEPIPGKKNTFRLVSTRDCARKVLSVPANCGQSYIDVWFRDDNNGQQHWTFEKVAGQENSYNIRVAGRACDRVFLSTRDVWDRVDLWNRRDNNNQQFSVEAFAPFQFEETDLEGVNVINSLGKTDGKSFVTQNRNCANNIQLFAGVDEQSAKFQFRAIPGKTSVYSIQNLSGCQRSFLSAPNTCAVYVDYWFRDDNDGNQHWIVQPIEGKQGAYSLRHLSKPAHCNRIYLSTRDVWNTVDLWSANDNDNQWWGIKPYQPAQPLQLPAIAQIVSLGKTDGRTELSADRDCNQQQVFLDQHVEFHREHAWKLEAVAGKLNTFRVISSRNCDRKFLSANDQCGNTYVDMWFRDDNSGRQHWYVKKVEGQESAYTLTIGGRACPRVHLSTRDVWDRVDLWNAKNNNNQWFDIQEFAPYTPVETNLEGLNVIKSLGKTDGKIFAAQNRNCQNNVQLFPTKEEQVSKFQFRAIPGKQSVYSIQNMSGCQRSFLSAPANCAVYVDYWFRDDNDGNQHWLVEPIEGKEGAYSIRHYSKHSHCTRVFLSTRDVWHTADLWSAKDNDNQWWGIEEYEPAKPIEVPTCAWVKSLGKNDGRTQLMAKEFGCDNTPYLQNPGVAHDGYLPDWEFKAVDGKRNTYNIIAKGTKCDRKYLSVAAGCGQTYIDLWTHDDKSGRQQWTISRVPGQENAYSIKVGGRACPRVFLSTRFNWDRIDLWRAVEDRKQHVTIEECQAPDNSEIEVPSCARIESQAKTDGRTFLSAHKFCNQHQAFLAAPKDLDTERFADWQMVPVEGKVNTYNIVISSKRGQEQQNCERRYLSVAAGCGQTYVDLWTHDDKSGRQQWTVSKVAGTSDQFTFEVGGRQNCDRVFLSTRKVWDRVDLWSSRFGTEQFFSIERGQCRFPDPEPVAFEQCNNIRSLGKVDDLTTMVAMTKNCNNAAWLADPKEIAANDVNEENWKFIPVQGEKNTFNIIAGDSRTCPRKFLSVAAGCGRTYVDLWTQDDKSGRQQWRIERVPGKENTYTLEVGGRGRCARNTLSTRPRWNRVDLWRDADSERQHFEINTCVSTETETSIPACGRIINQGKLDARTNLAFRENNCNNWSHLVKPGHEKFQDTFSFRPVEGQENTYNIVSRRTGCPRNFLSVGAGCGQQYIDLWHRDDGSGRQQWRIEKSGDGYTLVVGGRTRCDRVMLSTRSRWWRPDLWKENDGSGRQVWKINECPANEPAPTDNSANFWWRNPANNNWNWGPNWNQPNWNWRPNQGGNWRLWWRNNRQRNWRRNFGSLEWNRGTNFRFWLRFVRDNEYMRPRNFRLNAKFKLDAEAGSPEVFRGGEGFAFEWIQLKGWKGFGLIKVVGKDWYLRPRKVNGRIRNGSPVIIDDQLNWTCIWFWNGRRLRHFTGRWLRVTDDGDLVIQKRIAGNKSIWQMVGPDESPLENFPGVEFVPESILWNEDEVEEGDESIPADIVEEDAKVDNTEGEDNQDDADDDEEEIETVDVEDVEDVDTDEVDLDQVGLSDDEDVDEVDQEDGDEIDTDKLPLEEGQVTIVQPDATGRIPAGNCCNPVSRSKEAVAFNKESASAFVASYGSITGTGNSFIYTYIAEAFKTYPDSMNPIKVFNLGASAPEDNTMEPIVRHFATSLAQTDAQAAFNRRVARRVFRRTVNNLERQLEIIDFAVEMMRVAEDDKLGEFEKNQKIVHNNVNNFYKKALKPHRFAYKVYSRVPVSQGTVDTLGDNMIDKLRAFRVELRAMNRMGIQFRANRQMRIIARNARRLTRDGRYQRLRTILRYSRRVMVRINREVIQKNLQDNAEFRARYEAASNNLFRANDSKSVRCLGIWALKRRTIHVQPFENRILNGNVAARWNTESVEGLKSMISVLKTGETENAVDHIGPQREGVNSYIEFTFQVTREIAAVNWAQHQANERVRPNCGAFYRNYYTSMGNWRYALKNVAL